MKAPHAPAMTSSHHQHPVMRNAHGNVVVRHPPTPGLNMMSARPDYVEAPANPHASSQPGGLVGGLAPFQTQTAAHDADYDTD